MPDDTTPRTCRECGSPLPPRKRRYCSPACRFWSFVNKSGPADGCWPWTGPICKRSGYGQHEVVVNDKRKRTSAHRRAYHLSKGDPGRLLVRHACDIRACCNPGHLLLGTHRDNTLDAHVRDRPTMARLGEANRYAKLTSADVRAIRASTEPSTVLGPKFGVVPSRIRSIRRGEGWRHLDAALIDATPAS